MFGWFKKKPGALYPESLWKVSYDGASIRAIDTDGVSKELIKSDLAGVIIETNDTGPWGADVWWLLFGVDGSVAVVFPQGATGQDDVIKYLTGLPGFNHGAMVDAMSSTDKDLFLVWHSAR